MKTTVKKWGNSAAVRIPASVMEAMHLDLDQVVEMRVEKGRIVIEPARQKSYALSDPLKGIDAKNLHEAIEFGPRRAKSPGDGNTARARESTPVRTWQQVPLSAAGRFAAASTSLIYWGSS